MEFALACCIINWIKSKSLEDIASLRPIDLLDVYFDYLDKEYEYHDKEYRNE